MTITVHLKDGTTVVASAPNDLDVIHSPTDPKMIVVVNQGVNAFWISEDNFEYASNG